MGSTGHDYLCTLEDFGDAAPDDSRDSCLVAHAKRAALHVSCVHVAFMHCKPIRPHGLLKSCICLSVRMRTYFIGMFSDIKGEVFVLLMNHKC